GGRIRQESAQSEEGDRNEYDRHARHHDPYARHGSYHASRFLTVLFKNKLQVLKGEEIIASLPIAYYLFFALVAPHLFFFSIVLMFLCGCRIRRKQEPGSIREEDVSNFAANTARNIRTTVNSFTQTLKQEKSRPDDSSEEEGEVTVD
ncbi:MAG TPA: hypothetical protein PKE04_06850, partial [Clostridia bacterium]|nr:hypothetical protein [Clostridia bacterium]